MKTLFSTLLLLALFSCSSEAKKETNSSVKTSAPIQISKLDTATLAGGCFWCVEAAIEQVKGVSEVVSGYAGGTKENANYKAVSYGRTKHAEAVQVYFDPSIISYETILDIFFTAHDPTQLNRQGNDVGPQYRSAIFYHNENQKSAAEAKISELTPEFENKIVTEINPLNGFYLAEEYHQDFQKKNPYQPYIVAVSKPKVAKVKKKFPELIKEEN